MRRKYKSGYKSIRRTKKGRAARRRVTNKRVRLSPGKIGFRL